MDFTSLQKQLSKSLLALPQGLFQILSRRYGLEGNQGRNLDEMAKELDLSSEKVIEIEARAIRSLRKPKLIKPLIQSLNSLNHVIWMAIADKNQRFRQRRLSQRLFSKNSRHVTW
ncbi:MAG: hypothetical protein KJP23_21210 [Deltaproteobacteria bacterium]|nr:hypothetical protein [Deltaproteobacteria bacterium]